MAKEIERKFLVADLTVLSGLLGTPITQGYVGNGAQLVHVHPAGDKAYLTLRVSDVNGSFDTFKYEIPVTDAAQIHEQNGATGLLVRVRRAGDNAYLTLKGPRVGFSCDEFEYDIPVAHAVYILERHSKGGKVAKTRYLVPAGVHTYEVDVFDGFLAGLVVAEVEMVDEREVVVLPAWLGREVSTDMDYTNVNLAKVDGAGVPLPALS